MHYIPVFLFFIFTSINLYDIVFLEGRVLWLSSLSLLFHSEKGGDIMDFLTLYLILLILNIIKETIELIKKK